jgi:hypothetical protein
VRKGKKMKQKRQETQKIKEERGRRRKPTNKISNSKQSF